MLKRFKTQRAALALALGMLLAGCDRGHPPAAAVAIDTAAAPAAATAGVAQAAQPAIARDVCSAAFEQLRQCHSKNVSSGQASARRLEQSATYLRRLQAWWEMDRANPAIQASCTAIASGGIECEAGEPGDDAENDAEFKTLMEQFDKAGVPR
ncbi:MAG: hypothetical protein EOO29_05890 [Comamonadaceae bacterium]|nr:MAG: hypothetical protein EOO29_05890 [Comamonadaceae bacterium]